MFRKKQKDFYIEILEFIRDNPNITLQELGKFFPDEAKVISECSELREELFLPTNLIRNEKSKYVLNINARFKLLQHEQLEQARSSSIWAIWIAVGSLVIMLSG